MFILRKYLSLVFLLSFLMQAKGQNQITIEANSPRIGDSLIRHEMEYTCPGDGGEDAIWDFTNSHLTGKRYEDIVFCDSDSTTLRSVEVNAIYSYTICSDSLLLIRYETPQTMLEFDDPLLMTLYPSVMGIRFDDSYSAQGLYSGRLPISAGGMVSVEADGEGMLILNNGDTLRNVLRLHSIRTGYMDYSPLESQGTGQGPAMQQEIEEKHIWYARGYRYPVYETISRTYYYDLSPVSSRQTAYCRLPSDQRLLRDSINAEIVLQDSLALSSPPDIFHYSVDVGSGMITVSYSLDSPATLNALLCSATGMVYRSWSATKPAGENMSFSFDCSNLVGGSYVLYINVNGMIYSETVHI